LVFKCRDKCVKLTVIFQKCNEVVIVRFVAIVANPIFGTSIIFTSMLRVSQLYIYPIKSLGGIALD